MVFRIFPNIGRTSKLTAMCVRSGFIFCLLLLAGCGSKTPHDHTKQLVRLSDDEVKGLDPQAVTDLASRRVAIDQFEGLTRLGADGHIEPAMAASWSHSADGLVWTFRVRPNLYFSDGQPITASLFPAILARLRNHTHPMGNAPLFSAIDRIDAADNLITVHLRHPFPALPELLAHPAMAALPLHKISRLGPEWTAERPLTTSGAYQLIGWTLNDHIDLRTNPRWYGGTPPIRAVRWRPVTDHLTAMRSFEKGEADIATDPPAARTAEINRRSPGSFHVEPYLGTYYFAFNTRKKPFSDPRVRQALSMVVDRSWISGRLMKMDTRPAWGIIPPELMTAGPYRPAWSDWSPARRISEALKLLREAGYGERPLRFDIRFNSDPDHRRVAIALAAMWKPLGVEASLLNSEAALHFSSLRRGDFEIGRSGWIADVATPENFLELHRSDAGTINYSGYANPAFDRALDWASAEADPLERARRIRIAETILMKDQPILPLYFYVSRNLVGSRISGWKDNPENIHPSRTLHWRASS